MRLGELDRVIAAVVEAASSCTKKTSFFVDLASKTNTLSNTDAFRCSWFGAYVAAGKSGGDDLVSSVIDELGPSATSTYGGAKTFLAGNLGHLLSAGQTGTLAVSVSMRADIIQRAARIGATSLRLRWIEQGARDEGTTMLV